MTDANIFAVIVFGVLIGASELVSRHSDYRFHALVTIPSLAYLALNGALSVLALYAIQALKPEWLESSPTLAVLTAGFSAAAFFRSSIFKVKMPEGEIAVGPALVVDVFLGVIDEAVDRRIGEQRLIAVAELMSGVDFATASHDLPTLCLAALQRVPEEAQKQLGEAVAKLIANATISDSVRKQSLGLLIMKVSGLAVLRAGIREIEKRPDPVAREPAR